MQYQGFVKFIGPKETIGDGVEKQTIVLEENTDREFKGSIAVDFLRSTFCQMLILEIWLLFTWMQELMNLEINQEDGSIALLAGE